MNKNNFIICLNIQGIIPEMYKQVEIFTDGSCLGNPGPGGYGAFIRYNQNEKIFSNGYYITTNNRMELMAAIIAIESLKEQSKIILSTDSLYLQKGITMWIYNWKKYDWKTSEKKVVKNIDLWKRLISVLRIHQIRWKWIRSHTGHPENEKCDQLARIAALQPTLKDVGYKE